MVIVGLGTGSVLGIGFSLFQPLLGQIVNVGLGPAGILGIVVAIAGAGLYFLRSVRPELARDHDIFFAAVGLLCGGILFFQGWRLDPILMFGQLLLTGSAVFFAVESIRLRGVATDQAKRYSPIVDEERPVRPVYRVELEDRDYLDPAEDIPRIGSSARRDGGRARYVDDLEDDLPPPRRSKTSGRPGAGERPQKKRRPPQSREGMNESAKSRKPSRYSERDSEVAEVTERSPRPNGKRRRPRPEAQTDSPASADYVDYQPINYREPKQEPDNSSNFDDDIDQNW